MAKKKVDIKDTIARLQKEVFPSADHCKEAYIPHDDPGNWCFSDKALKAANREYTIVKADGETQAKEAPKVETPPKVEPTPAESQTPSNPEPKK